MRTRGFVCVFVLLCGAMAFATQRGAEGSKAGEEFVGIWSGSWEGGGSGGFELTLEKAADGPVTGKVSVTGPPTYKAVFKTLSFDGKKMAARYDFPEDDSIDIALAATFDGKTANGTWSARVKASDAEVAAGTWTVTKK